MTNKKWQPAEITFLRANYPKLTARQVGVHLGRTRASVKGKIQKLGLAIPDELRQHRRANAQFKPGHVPFNKGKKGQCAPGCEKTWFKAGHKPANTKHDGCITTRRDTSGHSYKWIRLSEGNWLELHRYLWQQEHGPIPRGGIIRFKNGDTLDCRLDNLELIDRAEHLRKNYSREKSAASMRKSWQEERHFKSDNYIASLLTQDPEERKELMKNPDILAAKRLELKLKREINHVSD